MKFYEAWDERRGGKSDRPLNGAATTSTTAYGRRALDAEVARVALAVEGSRNGTLNEAAFSVFQLVDAGEIDDGEAREALATAAHRTGLTPTEIMRTIASARDGASRNPRRKLPDPTPAPLDFSGLPRRVEPLMVPRGPEVHADGHEGARGPSGAAQAPNYDELYVPRSQLSAMPRGEALIEDVIDRHTLFSIVGRDRSFKSFVALDWLLCLATGRPWLGKTVVQSRVLYVVGEGAYGLDDRVRAWELAYPKERVEDDHFVVRRAPVNLFNPTAAFVDMLDRIERDKFEVIIFDTLQRMAGGAEQNSARDAGLVIAALDRVRKVSGGAVGVVAHSGKSDTDTRGSSAFEDDSDIVWRCRREDGQDMVRLSLEKRKDGPEDLEFDLWARTVGPSMILQIGEPVDLARRVKPLRKYTAEVLRLLAGRAVPMGGMSPTVILRESGVSGWNGLYGLLDDLMERGWVDKLDSGAKSTYKITRNGRSTLAKLDGNMPLDDEE